MTYFFVFEFVLKRDFQRDFDILAGYSSETFWVYAERT